LIASAAEAEEVEKKWRVGLQLGSYSNQGKVPSDSANRMFIILFNQDTNVIPDPRNEDAALGDLKIKSAPQVAVTAQYAFSRVFLVEAYVGYQMADVGEIEAQAQFDKQRRSQSQQFDFSIFRIPAGEVEQIPVQLSAIARFRPRSSFNPYVGAGIGYIFTSFKPTDEFNYLSAALDANQGVFSPYLALSPETVREFGLAKDLAGADVDAPGTFEWHLLGGAEYTFSRKWSLFLDLRYFFASRSMKIRFNGKDQLGVSVPDTTVLYSDPAANPLNYGPYVLPYDGIFDGGRLVPSEELVRAGLEVDEWQSWCIDPSRQSDDCFFSTDPIPRDPLVETDEWSAYCGASPDACFSPLDGETDPGYYYVKGGEIDYGGFSISLGVRYTF